MADAMPVHNPDREIAADETGPDPVEVVRVLQGYATEAEEARRSGPSPRDSTWEANWDRYWGRYDRSQKAEWQSKHVMPEVPQFVDRWAAAMREALDAAGEEWFTAEDEGGQRNELVPHVNKVMRILLSRCARTPDGHRADFSSVFEDQMKLGAIMACCASVTWDGDWVSVESTDPREVWLDPQGRNLYRLRRTYLDLTELRALAEEVDDVGDSLYDKEVIDTLSGAVDQERRNNRERSSGTGQGGQGTPDRKPIKLDEWLCTLIMPDGKTAGSNVLCVVANDKHLIRGPEDNPFWHEQDWTVLTPMVPVPFSPYGRSYMEDWTDVADAFIELTNLILDGVFTSTLKAFVADPNALQDPSQLANGISPNAIFQMAEEAGVDPRRVLRAVDLGTLPSEAVTVWKALKQEMREGAKLSEIALGQIPPKGDITATEVNQVSQSGSAMIRAMARTIESRFLEPILTLVWQTALQHMDFMELAEEIGEETARMLTAAREEFAARRIKFRVRGISGLVDRQTKLRNLLSALQIIGQNEILLQAFMQRTDADQLVQTLIQMLGVDPSDFELSDQERMVRAATQQPQQGQELAQ